MLVFEEARSGRVNTAQTVKKDNMINVIPEKFKRSKRPLLPEISEMQAVRHYTRLSQKNFSFLPTGFLHNEI